MKRMAEDKKESFWKKMLMWGLTSPVTLIFIVLILYYGMRAYVLEIDPWRSKVLMFAVTGLWVLWLVFKNLIKFLLLAAVAAAVFYGYYQYENRDKIACQEAGKEWNEEKKICEDKLTFMEKLEKMWNEYRNKKEKETSDKEMPEGKPEAKEE